MTRAGTVVFDLDGTLVDSAPAIARALNDMRAERGLATWPVESFRGWISHGAATLVAAALDETAPANAQTLSQFRRRYAAIAGTPDDLYHGVADSLAALQKAGITMGVCSNKPQALCDKVLAEAGIAMRFAAVVGGDAVQHSKPHPMHLEHTLARMGRSTTPFIFVGDSRIDAEAAERAGARFLWAVYGYVDSPALASAAQTLASAESIAAAVLDLLVRPEPNLAWT